MSDDHDSSVPLKAPHAPLAELFAHHGFLGADPSAIHVGGNARVRDHELFDCRVWANTKAGWWEPDGRLGFSPVGWTSAYRSYDQSLDLVSIVVLRPEDIRTRVTARSATFEWDPPEWYLYPASVLCQVSRRLSDAKAVLLDGEDPAPFLVEGELTSERLRALVASHFKHLLDHPLPATERWDEDAWQRVRQSAKDFRLT